MNECWRSSIVFGMSVYCLSVLDFCGHSNLVIYHLILSNFIYGLLSSKSCPSLNMYFVNANQDGR